MKTLAPVLLACAFASAVLAAESAKPATPAPAGSEKKAESHTVIPATEATVTAPFVLKDGAIVQPVTADLTDGGKAVFNVNVPKDGTYVIHAVVNAPEEDQNSFFINFDKQPEDPLMIWDMDVTKGFEERVVSWRGNGDANNDEFVPKKFKLTAGAHKLIVIGREPCSLKSISLRPAKE